MNSIIHSAGHIKTMPLFKDTLNKLQWGVFTNRLVDAPSYYDSISASFVITGSPSYTQIFSGEYKSTYSETYNYSKTWSFSRIPTRESLVSNVISPESGKFVATQGIMAAQFFLPEDSEYVQVGSYDFIDYQWNYITDEWEVIDTGSGIPIMMTIGSPYFNVNWEEEGITGVSRMPKNITVGIANGVTLVAKEVSIANNRDLRGNYVATGSLVIEEGGNIEQSTGSIECELNVTIG